MRKSIDLNVLPYALGALLLAAVTFAFKDFALQWQPVPAGIPARAPLAMVSSAVLLVGALAALWRSAGAARLTLAGFYLLWVVALHLPVVVRGPSVGTLLGLAEILSLAAAGATLAPPRAPRWLVPAARIAFGLSALVFGLSHFVYAGITASMVPAWLPVPLFWAYLTGAGHFAAGLGILSGQYARVAATAEAAMCGCFVLLLHLPRVIAAPDSRIEWTMLAVSLSITGAAWLIRRRQRP